MMERPLRNLKVMRFRSNVLLTNEKMRRTTWGLADSERTMLASAVICYQPEFQHDVNRVTSYRFQAFQQLPYWS